MNVNIDLRNFSLWVRVKICFAILRHGWFRCVLFRVDPATGQPFVPALVTNDRKNVQ